MSFKDVEFVGKFHFPFVDEETNVTSRVRDVILLNSNIFHKNYACVLLSQGSQKCQLI